jgi:predicted lipoprotein with Yx(FWY)xxD motif
MNRFAASALIITCLAGTCVLAQEKKMAPKAQSKETKIAHAVSAAPANIAKAAKVVELDGQGKETVLRDGTNGFICYTDHPGEVGGQAYCANEAARQWDSDFAAHKSQPTNAVPGIEYMLLGGTDWSASDPNASSGKPIQEPPHWMILWPVDPRTTGLSVEPKQTGTWIMWAGTPYSHLMINQHP